MTFFCPPAAAMATAASTAAASTAAPAGALAGGGARLSLVTLVVTDYDAAIAFFVGTLGFDLVEDSPSLTNDGRPKRWVVVRPPGAATGLLLARADGADQAAVVGRQVAGRVGFFITVDDFEAAYRRLAGAGVRFATAPRDEAYGRVAVFCDLEGNKWDLIGPVVGQRVAAHQEPR